ncbi:MAG: terminase large subunit [Clostridia bacterium]|nr:terminase large subunit [Clostridia bacterium]
MDNAIFAYYQGIKNGEIVVGMWIRLVYEYIVKGLESKAFFFSAKKANRAITFIEGFCHHSKGRNDLLKLELWQKAAISCIFGIVDEMGVRIFREVIIIIGRKNGKSLLAAAIIAYCLYMDGEYGAEIYCAAPKLDQADMVYRAFEQIVSSEDELQEITRRRKADIYVEETNSNVKKIAFNAKKSDGFNPHLVVCDEIASWPGDQGLKQYEVLKSGMGSRKQPLMLSISTSGYVNEGIYDELIKRCTRFLLGDSREKRILPLLYMIDEMDKWNDINELRKSNPNLGVSVSIDYLLEEIAVAEGSLSKKTEFITKYCNLKQSSSLAWLPSRVVEAARGSMPGLESFRGCYCVGGIDLSQTTDLTACCAVIEKGGKLYVFTQFFMPREKIDEATARDGLPYRKYVQLGLVTESGENMVDYEDCYRWFVDLVEKYRIYPLKVGYDRYSALELVKRMQNYGFHMESVYQGENLTGVINLTEGTAKDGTFAIGENDLMAVHMLNSALKLNAETGRKRLIKLRATDRIDGMAALLDAMCMRQNYGEELGDQLRNKRAA